MMEEVAPLSAISSRARACAPAGPVLSARPKAAIATRREAAAPRATKSMLGNPHLHEEIRRQVNAGDFELLREARADAGRPELSGHSAVAIDTALLEAEEVLPR